MSERETQIDVEAPEAEWEASVQRLIRKFRSGQIVGLSANITPDTAGAIADAITLVEARRKLAQAQADKAEEIVESYNDLVRRLTRLTIIPFGAGLFLGWALGGFLT